MLSSIYSRFNGIGFRQALVISGLSTLLAIAQAAPNWKIISDRGESCVVDKFTAVPWMPKKGKNIALMEAFAGSPDQFKLYWRVAHVFGSGSYYPLDELMVLRFSGLDPINRGVRDYEALTRSGMLLSGSDNASPLRTCDFGGGQGESRCLPVLQLKFNCKDPETGNEQLRSLNFDANGLAGNPALMRNENELLFLSRMSKELVLGVAAQIRDEEYGRIAARFSGGRASSAELAVKEKLKLAALREAALEQQKNEAKARSDKADAILRRSRKDTIMHCDSGQTALPSGESIVSLAYRCDLIAGETYNLRTILRAGWVIDAEIRTLVETPASGPLYHVVLRMRKAT